MEAIPLSSPKPLSSLPKPSKSPLPVPALYHDDGESELESEDDGFDRPHHPQVTHRPMEVDVDEDGEEDMLDSDVDEQLKNTAEPSAPRVVFDDDGESEMEEPESEEEPDVPLPLPISKPPFAQAPPQGTFLHVSHKVFPNHNRPFGELNPSTSSTVFAQDRHQSSGAPFVPYARAPPPHTHVAYQRAWLVPNPHIMHVKRREQSMMESGATQPIVSPSRPPLPEIRPREVPQQYPYIIPRTPMIHERRPSNARKTLRRPYQCLYHECQQAFPSPKDRGRHMDKHFEGRFECLRCHKKYARLDALKRHSSEQFRPKLTWTEGMSTRAYNVTTSCVGGFETREWVELSGSRWLKPENVMHLRLPEPQDPLYPTISRLMVEAHHGNLQQQQHPDASTSTFVAAEPSSPVAITPEPPLPAPEPTVRVKAEPSASSLSDADMVASDSEDRNQVPSSSYDAAHTASILPEPHQPSLLSSATSSQSEEAVAHTSPNVPGAAKQSPSPSVVVSSASSTPQSPQIRPLTPTSTPTITVEA